MTAAFFLAQHVHFSLEFGVRLDASRSSQNLTALDVLLLDTSHQQTDVVAGDTLIKALLEHFHAGHGHFEGVPQTNDLNLGADRHLSGFNTTSGHGTATFDREHVFDSHHEGFVDGTLRFGNVAVKSFHEVGDALAVLFVSRVVECTASIAADERHVVAWETVLGQQLADFHFDQVEQFSVVDKVALVQEDHQGRYGYLTRQQDVLASLRHGAVSSRHHQDGTVHLSSTGNHVLDVVGVSRTVNMSIVTVRSLVFDVAGRNRHSLRGVAHSSALGNVRVRLHRSQTLCRLHRKNCRRGGCLAVVNVTNRTHIHVRLRSLKLTLCH